MYKVAIFSSDEILVQRISNSIDFLNCSVSKFAAKHENFDQTFFENFDLIFVHVNEQLLHTKNFSLQRPSTGLKACQIVLVPDHQFNWVAPLLDLGYDRCLSESFDQMHLAALVRALLRRRQGLCSSVSFYGDLEFNHATKKSWLKSVALNLTPREAQILDLLLRRVGQIVLTEDFLAEIDPHSQRLAKSTIHVYVHRLRVRVSSNILPIRNIKRNGYFLEKYRQAPLHQDVPSFYESLLGYQTS